jgi:predicted MFS family arabinose efflux permease
MVYPGLHALTAERYGITINRASWFTLVPTLGAIVSAFFLPRLVRSRSPLAVLRLAAILEALLLAAVALPIPFGAVIALRFLSGACDLAGIAATLRLATRVAGSEHRARSLGWMGTAIMSGLLGGIGLGIAISTSMVIVAAAAILVLLAAGTLPLSRIAPNVHDADPSPEPADAAPARRRQRVVASILVATDRGLSAVLATVIPMAIPLIAIGPEVSQKRLAGTILGLSMLGMVIGGPLVGEFVDRAGPGRVRLFGSLLFGFGVMAIVFVAPLGSGAMIAAAALAGAGAAPLFASALSIGTHDRTSTGVYGAIQAAGQAGYAVGGASLLLSAPLGIGPTETLAAGAILYVAVNLAASWVLTARS